MFTISGQRIEFHLVKKLHVVHLELVMLLCDGSVKHYSVSICTIFSKQFI